MQDSDLTLDIIIAQNVCNSFRNCGIIPQCINAFDNAVFMWALWLLRLNGSSIAQFDIGGGMDLVALPLVRTALVVMVGQLILQI